MTGAEKLAAEWEARHDVAARGRRSAPDALQHYVAHERMVGSGPPHRPSRAEGGSTGDTAGAAQPPADGLAPRPGARRRRFFRWPRRGRG